MRSDELDYVLPPELIAQHPADRRDASRLLVYDRATGAVRHRTFSDLPSELAGELVVVNDTKVVPARLNLQRESGGAAAMLFSTFAAKHSFAAHRAARPQKTLGCGLR